MSHKQLVDAFELIKDRNALAWSVTDTKSELFVTSAIALSANRLAGARVAHVEYPPRVDLVLKVGGEVKHAYLAKAGYVTDFQPKAIAKSSSYLGGDLNKDIEKLPKLCERLGPEVSGSGLFYLYEISDSSRQTKYGGRPKVQPDDAVTALKRFVSRGVLVRRVVLDCGNADGAGVRIHLCIFDPAPASHV